MFVYINDVTLEKVIIRQNDTLDKPEEVKSFEAGCFSNDFQDERITFYGHGNALSFGGSSDHSPNLIDGNTPEEFVAKLKEYNLPNTVKIIDLVGCDIGLRIDPNVESYSQKVARLLAEENDERYLHFKDIQVRSFQEFNLDNHYAESLIVTSAEEGKFYVKCLTQEQADWNEKAIRFKDSKMEGIDDEIENAKTPRDIEKVKQRLLEAKKANQEYRENFKQLGYSLAEGSNYREALDKNLAFHVKPLSAEEYRLIEELIQARKALGAINKKIRKLEHQQDKLTRKSKSLKRNNHVADFQKNQERLTITLLLLKQELEKKDKLEKSVQEKLKRLGEVRSFSQGESLSTEQQQARSESSASSSTSTQTPTTTLKQIKEDIQTLAVSKNSNEVAIPTFKKQPASVKIGNRGYFNNENVVTTKPLVPTPKLR